MVQSCQAYMFTHNAMQTLERVTGASKDVSQENSDVHNKQLVLRKQAYNLLQHAALNSGRMPKGTGEQLSPLRLHTSNLCVVDAPGLAPLHIKTYHRHLS